MKNVFITVITLAALLGCNKKVTTIYDKYDTIIDAVVVSKNCMIITPTGSIEPNTGETLVKAYVGQQLGSLAGEAVAGKTGGGIGGVIGASTATSGSSKEPPRTYCELQLTLDDGTSTELIVEDYRIETLKSVVSLARGKGIYNDWRVIDRVPKPSSDVKDTQASLPTTYTERVELATHLLSGNLEQRMAANRQLTTEMECVYTVGIPQHLERRRLAKEQPHPAP